MKFSVRDLLWLTFAAALAIGWWIDRTQLAFPAADYRRLKAEEEQRAEFFRMLRQVPFKSAGAEVIEQELARGADRKALTPPGYDEFLEVFRSSSPDSPSSDQRLGPDGLRSVPGEKDYQFPPEYPLHYGPSRSP